MTDEARIARLTELARRVWPDAAAAMVDGVASVVEIPGYYECLYIARHPCALDALEAALLVLADEERVPLTERRVLEDRIAALERDRATLLRRYQEEQAKVAILDDAFRTASAALNEAEAATWAEQLAKAWDERAAEHEAASQRAHDANKDHHGAYQAGVATGRTACARELRERAKGEPCE